MKQERNADTKSSPPKAWQGRVLKTGWTLGAAGIGAWVARYLVQGTSQVWTDTARALYVEDPNLGWVPTDERWVWLGLEGLGVIAGVLVGSLLMWWLGRRGGKGAAFFRALGVLGAASLIAAPVLPLMAFFGGTAPAGALAVLPRAEGLAAAPAAPAADSAAVVLPLVAGRWVPSSDPAHALVVAQLTAGGETFDAKFTPLTGSIALRSETPAASSFKLGVVAGSVATGIPLRDSHARGYLEVETHQAIEVTADLLGSVGAGASPDEYTWSATTKVALMGRTLSIPTRGKLRILQAQARKELGLSAAEGIVVEGALEIPVADTALDPELFDTKTLSLSFRAVFVPDAAATPKD